MIMNYYYYLSLCIVLIFNMLSNLYICIPNIIGISYILIIAGMNNL